MIHFRFHNVHISNQTQLATINMPSKWHHISICNKDCNLFDMFYMVFGPLEMWFYPCSHFSLEVHNGITNHKYFLMFATIFFILGTLLGVFYKIKINCMTVNDLFPLIPCKPQNK